MTPPSQTDLAEDRTILASERTFAGWVRTSLGFIAIGIGFHALFNRMQPEWVPRGIASLFLVMAGIVVWLAARRADSVTKRLSPHVVARAGGVNLELIAAAISLAAMALTGAIWLLPFR
jgi:putative membrane protein